MRGGDVVSEGFLEEMVPELRSGWDVGKEEPINKDAEGRAEFHPAVWEGQGEENGRKQDMVREVSRNPGLQGLGCHAKEPRLSFEGSRDCIERLALAAV